MPDYKPTLQTMNAGAESLQVSVIVPTYQRHEVLRDCLQHLADQDLDKSLFEVRVYDNGTTNPSREVVAEFSEKVPNITYTCNEPGHGFGYSICRGVNEVTGCLIVELNDDAMVPTNFLSHLISLFSSDQKIGVVGVRAIEEGYRESKGMIGFINNQTGEIVGNFSKMTQGPIDCEHVYGFCYAYRNELITRGGTHDKTLLAQDYSSGNRLETDHCLTAKTLGYRVIYDGSVGVIHRAEARPDLDEQSLNWKKNHWRNTLYVYLKQFGLFGRKSLAIRFALKDFGVISVIRKPNVTNFKYVATGISAKCSAVAHWLRYQTSDSKQTLHREK